MLPAVVRTPITSMTNTAATKLTPSTDSWWTFVSNDGITYATNNDNITSNANFSIGKFTSNLTLAYTPVNLLTAYGVEAGFDGTDGPVSPYTSTNKQSGLFGMLGNLYIFANRGQYPNSTNPNQATYFGNVIKSTDHGATWNNWLTLTPANANGIEPPVTGGSKGQYQFANSQYGWVVPIRYAADDGTVGYATAGNRHDGANAFVYATIISGNIYNQNNLYLMRMARSTQFDAQSTTQQYWVCTVGCSPVTPASFVNDANWSTSDSGKTAIYSASNAISWGEVEFIPGVNEYLLPTFSVTGLPTVTFSSSSWTILSGPTPAGPWTSIYTQSNGPTDPCTVPGDACAYYGMAAVHSDEIANTATSNIKIRVLYSGSPSAPGYLPYALTYSTFTLNPTYGAVESQGVITGSVVQ